MNWESVIVAAATSKLLTLTWVAPPKMMPFWLMRYTWPCALIEPKIWLGLPDGSRIRFSATQLLATTPPALWLKSTVVFLPTLKVCQFKIACADVCWIVTVVWPPVTDWVGRLAPFHSALFPVAICNPPVIKPLGTLLLACKAASIPCRLLHRLRRLQRVRCPGQNVVRVVL